MQIAGNTGFLQRQRLFRPSTGDQRKSRLEFTADGEPIDAKRLIAQYMLLYQMSLPQGMELTNQIDIQNRSTRVTAFAKSYSSFELLEHTDNMEAWINENIPGVQAVAVGVPIMFGRLMTLAIPGMLKSIGISLFFIRRD